MFASWYAPGEYNDSASGDSATVSEGEDNRVITSSRSGDFGSSSGKERGKRYSSRRAFSMPKSLEHSLRSLRNQKRTAAKYVIYLERYIFVTCWLVLLALGLVVSKVWCKLGLPANCETEFVTPPSMERLQALFLYGLVMSWMCGISVQPRFWSLFSARRWWFFFIYAVSSPIFAAIIGDKDSTKFTDVSVVCCDAKSILVIVVLSTLATVGIVWHMYYAFAKHRTEEAVVYTISRLIFVVFYLSAFCFLQSDVLHESYAIEPYIIAFVLSLFCQFDHWFSISLLGIFLGIFVQSLATADLSTGLFSSIENCQSAHAVEVMSRFSASLSSDSSLFRANVCLIKPNGQPELISPPDFQVHSVEVP